MIIPVVVFYCILTVIALWFIIGGKGHWLIKTILVPIFVWFGVAVGVTMGTMLGWPSVNQLPAEYEFYWAEVDTPNIKTGYEGQITIMYKDLHGHERKPFSLYWPKKHDNQMTVIPYSRQTHQRILKALQMRKKGIRVKGTNGKGKGKGQKGKGNGKKGNGKKGERGERDPNVGPKFYVMPPRGLPEKNK